MTPTPNHSIPWLSIGGAAALAVGAVVLVLGMVSASEAASNRQDAESMVAAQQSAVVTSGQDLASAEVALQAARSEGSEARSDAQAAVVTLEDARLALDSAESFLGDLRARVPRFVSEVGDLTDEVAVATSMMWDLTNRQHSQIEAILAGDYNEFNDLYRAFVEPAGAVATELADLDARFEGLPEVPISEPYEYRGASLEGRLPELALELDPPTGPAVITVELPAEIACTPWGDGGCKYSWIAEFIESNWLGVTIDRLGIRYRRGSLYCTIGAPSESVYEREWDDVFISVPPSGSDTARGSLSIDPSDECWPIRGGELLLRWEGTDAEGHNLSGRATAPLESPG